MQIQQLKELETFIDISYLEEIIKEQVKLFNSAYSSNDRLEKKEALRNTLSFIEIDLTLTQLKIFYKLIEFDKIVYLEGTKIFLKLFYLIYILFIHDESLEKLYDLENKLLNEKGIAKTSHPIVNDAIVPRIKNLNENLKYNPIRSNKIQAKIYKEFQENPLEIDAMYSVINQFDKSIFKNENSEVLNTIYNQRTYLNSAVKLEDYHIYTSCQILCFSMYRKNSLVNYDLKIKKRISNNKIAFYIDTIVKSFFHDVFDKPLTRHHINKPIQVKCYFNDFPIHEYRTKTNYKPNPIFENV